jgi:outer membrane murein-binding lipoprotein Lpp
MLNHCNLSFGRRIQGVFTLLLTLVFIGIGILGSASPAAASSKVMTTEDLELVMGEAAQEFVESILDDYSDTLEDSFEAVTDPVKSAVKSLTKQMSKAAKPGGEAALATQITASQEALSTAMASFDTLTAQTESFKETLNSAPDLIKEALETQLGVKFTQLDTAVAELTAAVDQLATDAEGLDASDPEAVTALTEHATQLSAAIEAIDLAIDGFDS